MRRILAAVLVGLAACGSTPADSRPETTPTVGRGNTSTTDEPPTTVLAPRSTAAATSTTNESTTTTLSRTAGTGTLPDGRPATFVAVTDDYEAVEVDTITGEILRSLGQTGTSADFSAEGELGPNVLDAVWRSADGSLVFVSDCCEPASGIIYLLTSEEQIRDGRTGLRSVPGWSLGPAPGGDDFATLNEAISIVDPERPTPPAIGRGSSTRSEHGRPVAQPGTWKAMASPGLASTTPMRRTCTVSVWRARSPKS